MKIAFGSDERTALTDAVRADLEAAALGAYAATAAGTRRWNDVNVLVIRNRGTLGPGARITPR